MKRSGISPGELSRSRGSTFAAQPKGLERGKGLANGPDTTKLYSDRSRRKPISQASKAQRDKVAGLPCLNCGAEASEYVAIDPAHLWARGRGGCDDALCVVPLCRRYAGQGCHPAFDDGRLDLLAKLVPRFAEELGHALVHAEGNLAGLHQRLTGERGGLGAV